MQKKIVDTIYSIEEMEGGEYSRYGRIRGVGSVASNLTARV